MQSLTGEELRIGAGSDQRLHVLILSPSCPHCVRQRAVWSEWTASWNRASEPYVILGFGQPERVRAFVDGLGFDATRTIHVASAQMLRSLGVTAVPAYLQVEATGRVQRGRGRGSRQGPWSTLLAGDGPWSSAARRTLLELSDGGDEVAGGSRHAIRVGSPEAPLRTDAATLPIRALLQAHVDGLGSAEILLDIDGQGQLQNVRTASWDVALPRERDGERILLATRGLSLEDARSRLRLASAADEPASRLIAAFAAALGDTSTGEGSPSGTR